MWKDIVDVLDLLGFIFASEKRLRGLCKWLTFLNASTDMQCRSSVGVVVVYEEENKLNFHIVVLVFIFMFRTDHNCARGARRCTWGAYVYYTRTRDYVLEEVVRDTQILWDVFSGRRRNSRNVVTTFFVR